MATKIKHYWLKLILLVILSFTASVLPVLIVMIKNWGNYTDTPANTFKLCIGGFFCVVFVFLKVIGKLHLPRRIVFFGILFLMVYLLQAVLRDLLLLSGMALLGEFIDCLCFQIPIKRLKERHKMEKQASITAEEVKRVLAMSE